MKDHELDELLKSASVPERSNGYWQDFPRNITVKARRHAPIRQKNQAWVWWLAPISVGCAIAMVVFFHRTAVLRPLPADEQLAAARKCFRELEALFPHQLQAIVLDHNGPRMVLADAPSVPDSPPFYLRICGPKACESFVTFSGQQIEVRGEKCEVLADDNGRIFLAGQHHVWSERDSTSALRIEAMPLGVAL